MKSYMSDVPAERATVTEIPEPIVSVTVTSISPQRAGSPAAIATVLSARIYVVPEADRIGYDTGVIGGP